MVEKLAEKLSQSIKRLAPEETASIEVMKYGITVLINSASVILLSLSIGVLTGKFQDALVALISYAVLRCFAGGFHFQSAIACIMFSTALFSIIPHIPISHFSTLILTLLALIIISIFAPSNIADETRIQIKYHPLLKACSILIVSVNFFLVSPILAKSFFTLSLFTVKLRRNTA